jgi:tRNA A-37 threonylcarbamoyl transferase component Bud32
MKLARKVVEAGEYLHRMDFVHGSLAARNILLTRFQRYINVKVSDYGMTRVIDGSGANYFKVC